MRFGEDQRANIIKERDICLNEIGLRLQILLNLIVNTIGRTYNVFVLTNQQTMTKSGED